MLVIAGDGGTYDIGFQALSGAAERNEDMVYVCLDNEGYMNTGAQKSSSTPYLASTTSTPGGKPSDKKDIAEIMAAHRIPYVATATVGYPDDLARKVAKARDMKGMRFIVVLTPCLDGWGVAENEAVRRLATGGGDRVLPALRGRGRRALHDQPRAPGSRSSAISRRRSGSSTCSKRRCRDCRQRSTKPGRSCRRGSSASRARLPPASPPRSSNGPRVRTASLAERR